MDIKVLGTGCKKCNATKSIIREVLSELGEGAQVEEITDMSEIIKYKVLATPAVMIDGKVVSKGKVPKKKDVLKWIGDSKK